MTYSVAIRTLGKNPSILKQELESVFAQSVLPQKVIIYIAEGYDRPSFSVGSEEYVWVKKGMVAQRALKYDEIDSDCILLLDDDVELAKESVSRMLNAMERYDADCVGADTFRNQNLSIAQKIFAALTNLVFPHWNSKWAFRIHANGSFSYNNNPKRDGFYWSESCAGPCSLWKKSSHNGIHLWDELWMDSLGFAYDDDKLTFYKLIANGGKLGILYDCGVINLDAKTSSGAYHRDYKKFYIRSFMSFVNWHRMIFSPPAYNHFWCVTSFSFKLFWLLMINILAGLVLRSWRVPANYVKGFKDALAFVASEEYKQLNPFIVG